MSHTRHAPVRTALRLAALGLLAGTATLSLSSAVAQSVSGRASAERPLYKDPSQPVERRVEDLLQRMTLEEKVGQMVAIWEHKDKIQTPRGDFSPAEASARSRDRRTAAASPPPMPVPPARRPA
jgi:beta-glucosidase